MAEEGEGRDEKTIFHQLSSSACLLSKVPLGEIKQVQFWFYILSVLNSMMYVMET